MNASRLLLVAAAALASAAAPAFADEADGSQYGMQFTGTQTRAEVQADLTQYRQAAVNPWAMQYNPLATFQGERTRAQVRGEYLANRDAVHALTGEDSGSAYLTGGEPSARANRLAGQPLRIVQ